MRGTFTDDQLITVWRDRFAVPTAGWNFTEFANTVETTQPPWSYSALARHAATGIRSALDLGTGGGEMLLTLRDGLPADLVATEGWPPNLPVARAALTPHHIDVVPYNADQGDALPFPDGRFDLVLSRHEAYRANDVRRVLAAGGRFVTQQVDGHNLDDLATLFGAAPAHPLITLAQLRDEALGAGLAVETAQEWSGPIRFHDVATMMAYLRLMPWQLPDDFAVDTHADTLLRLHREDKPLIFTERRFVLVCRR